MKVCEIRNLRNNLGYLYALSCCHQWRLHLGQQSLLFVGFVKISASTKSCTWRCIPKKLDWYSKFNIRHANLSLESFVWSWIIDIVISGLNLKPIRKKKTPKQKLRQKLINMTEIIPWKRLLLTIRLLVVALVFKRYEYNTWAWNLVNNKK